MDIEITKTISISENELVYKASRSSGPGGQNVNKLNTRITLVFNVAESDSLSEFQKEIISKRLASRIDKTGNIRVISQKHRTQEANRRAALERLGKILSQALERKPVRIKTKVSYSAKQKRLDEKKRRSRLKKIRTDKNFDF